MLAGILFVMWRLIQLVTLIPLIGMLSWLVHGFVQDDALTPNFVLVLFIASVLAGVWAVATLLFYATARRSGYFLALVDLGIFAALIAGVVELRGIAGQSCNNFSSTGYFGLRLAPFIYQLTKTCNVLKACFAFGIMNIIFFFFTFILGLLVHHHYKRKHGDGGSGSRETHYTRHSHRRSGGGSSRAGSTSRDRRRSGGSNYGGGGGGGGGRSQYSRNNRTYV